MTGSMFERRVFRSVFATWFPPQWPDVATELANMAGMAADDIAFCARRWIGEHGHYNVVHPVEVHRPARTSDTVSVAVTAEYDPIVVTRPIVDC